MKNDQITIRISKELKDKIDIEAKSRKITSSQFIRELLENGMEGSNKNSRLRSYEPNYNLQSENKRDLLTAALTHIISIDSGIPVNEAIEKVEIIFEEILSPLLDISKLSRKNTEEELNSNLFREDVPMSKLAQYVLSIICLTFNSVETNSGIFQPYGLSLIINDLISKYKLEIKDPDEIKKDFYLRLRDKRKTLREK